MEARDIKCLRPVFHYSSVDRMSNLMTHIHSHPSDQTHQTSSDVYVSLVLNSCIVSLFGRARVESFLFLSSSLIAFLPFPFLSSSSPLFLSPSFPVPSFLTQMVPSTTAYYATAGSPTERRKEETVFFFARGSEGVSFDVVSCKSLRATDAPSCPRKAMGVVWLCTTTKPLPMDVSAK